MLSQSPGFRAVFSRFFEIFQAVLSIGVQVPLVGLAIEFGSEDVGLYFFCGSECCGRIRHFLNRANRGNRAAPEGQTEDTEKRKAGPSIEEARFELI